MKIAVTLLAVLSLAACVSRTYERESVTVQPTAPAAVITPAPSTTVVTPAPADSTTVIVPRR